jgi:glycopeptide antibiotics resistance protein
MMLFTFKSRTLKEPSRYNFNFLFILTANCRHVVSILASIFSWALLWRTRNCCIAVQQLDGGYGMRVGGLCPACSPI